MKIIIDTQKTIGNKIIYVNHYNWTDFNNKTKILGTKFEIVLPEQNYEKIYVKVNKMPDNFKDISPNTEIDFVNLTATPYVQNNFIKWSFKADDVEFFQLPK